MHTLNAQQHLFQEEQWGEKEGYTTPEPASAMESPGNLRVRNAREEPFYDQPYRACQPILIAFYLYWGLAVVGRQCCSELYYIMGDRYNNIAVVY